MVTLYLGTEKQPDDGDYCYTGGFAPTYRTITCLIRYRNHRALPGQCLPKPSGLFECTINQPVARIISTLLAGDYSGFSICHRIVSNPDPTSLPQEVLEQQHSIFPSWTI